MDLDADMTILSNALIFLHVINGRDTVNPSCYSTTVTKNSVLIPAVTYDRSIHCLHIRRLDNNFIAAGLVVQLAPPSVTNINLVAAYFMAIGKPHTAHLYP